MTLLSIIYKICLYYDKMIKCVDIYEKFMKVVHI